MGPYRGSLIHENKWRAAQKGVKSKLIDLGSEKKSDLTIYCLKCLIFEDVVDDLGTREYVENIQFISKEGTSADKQIKIYEEAKSMKDVVDFLIKKQRNFVSSP